MVVRPRQDAGAVLPAVLSALRRENPAPVAFEIRSVVSLVAEAAAPSRERAELLSLAALLALALGVVGIFSVSALAVRSRRAEIGVRLALGARRGATFAWFFGRGIEMAAAGTTLGLIGGAWLGRIAAAQIPGLTAPGLWVLVAAGATSMLAAAAATLGPAWSAAGTDPAICLRSE